MVGGTPSQVDRGAWSESSARAVLQLMVESIAEMADFEVAALSVVLGDELVTLAYAGPEEHRAFLEESDPVSVIEPVLARACALGPRVRFLESTPLEQLEGHWVRIEQVPTDHPDAWQPDDGLLAVLTDDEDTVVGILSVDRPCNGRRPDARRLDLLERYAAQAEHAVLTLFESQALLEQVAHAESARRLVRSASRPWWPPATCTTPLPSATGPPRPWRRSAHAAASHWKYIRRRFSVRWLMSAKPWGDWL